MNEKLQTIECFLLDMDGTVYLSDKPIAGAAEAVARMRRQARVLFLTNNTSAARTDYVRKLCGMGIEVTDDDIYTAGNATIDYLQRTGATNRVFLLGTPNLRDEFLQGGISLCDENPDLVVIGFDTTLTYARLADACAHIRRGVPYIATHPDFNCPVRGGYIPDVGSFLALIHASTGAMPLLVCGKPNAPIADGVAQKVGLSGKKIAMVGDRLMTDMRFALDNGFTSVLVLSGEADERALQNCGFAVDVVLPSIAEWDA